MQGMDFGQLLLSLLSLQKEFIQWAWGTQDPFWMMAAKRSLVFLPLRFLLLGFWTSLPSLASVLVRQKRQQYLAQLSLGWWDAAKSCLMFWGGCGRFAMLLAGSVAAALKAAILFIWFLLQDLARAPYLVAKHFKRAADASGLAWLALGCTLAWCVLKAAVLSSLMAMGVVEVLPSLQGRLWRPRLLSCLSFYFCWP